MISDNDQRAVDRIVEELSLQHGGASAEVAVGGCGIVYVSFQKYQGEDGITVSADYEIAIGGKKNPEVIHSLVITDVER